MRVSPIAIDFGSERLKLLQLVPGNPPQLLAAAEAQVPAEARADASARQLFFGQALRDLLKKQPFKGRRAICSLPAYQTLVQNLEVGRADQSGLDDLVADQLRERMNVDPARMVIRHHSLGQVVRNGTNMQQVLCLAASRDVVMQYVSLCAESKLDLVGMHSEPMAILRAFADPDTETDGPAVCYIDIGAATTKLVIAHGGAVKFAKTVHAASDQLAGQPAAQAQAQAQTQAQTQTVAAGQAGGESVGAGEGMAMLNAATNEQAPAAASGDGETVEYLIDELQMCLRYHQGLFPKKPMEKLVFIGGGARQVQTCQRLARAVRVAAQLGDPLARMARVSAAKPPVGVDLDESQPGWTVPFGLCHSEANL
ncbi:MAG: hypothetical protein ACODAQ_10340 [Phycisphaeraceae bacterium]